MLDLITGHPDERHAAVLSGSAQRPERTAADVRLVVPAVIEIACLILGVTLDQPWFFVIAGSMLVPFMICSGLLYRNWPTGIRIDESAITIGAVRSARAARRRPTVNHQSWGRYTCPWPAVLAIRIVTDRAELRR